MNLSEFPTATKSKSKTNETVYQHIKNHLSKETERIFLTIHKACEAGVDYTYVDDVQPIDAFWLKRFLEIKGYSVQVKTFSQTPYTLTIHWND